MEHHGPPRDAGVCAQKFKKSSIWAMDLTTIILGKDKEKMMVTSH